MVTESKPSSPSLAGALVAMWGPPVVGAIALVAFRNLYGVAVLVLGWGAALLYLGTGRPQSFRRVAVGLAAVCFAVGTALVVAQTTT